jgi:hypothetical protein
MHTIFKYTWLTVLLVALLLSGCRSTATIQQTYAYESIKPGATLSLQRAIRFPADTAAVNIQNGEIRSRQFSLNQYYPNCRLELKSQPSEPLTIQPGRFTIYKITHHIEYVMRDPVRVAGWGINLFNSDTDEIYSTTLYLKSTEQAEVELLSCQHWEDPTDFPVHLTLKQIRQTLHGLMTIETN